MVKSEKLLELFDIGYLSEEEQLSFIEDVGELVMQRVFERAIGELQGEKRDTLFELLEVYEEDPENSEKQNAILLYLDEVLPSAEAMIKEELEAVEATFKEYRDEMLDALV